MHRIFHERIPPAGGGPCRIEGGEAHHAVRVKRVREGETVVLFDGAGTVGEGSVERVETTKRGSAIEVRPERVETFPPSGPRSMCSRPRRRAERSNS